MSITLVSIRDKWKKELSVSMLAYESLEGKKGYIHKSLENLMILILQIHT